MHNCRHISVIYNIGVQITGIWKRHFVAPQENYNGININVADAIYTVVKFLQLTKL